SNNNFMANAIAINNVSPIVQVEASGNYFEAAADEKVTGAVSLVNKLSEKVSLVCDYPPDTLLIPSGSADSVALHVQNFDLLTDSVLVTISDERGWVSGALFQTGALSNNTGAIFYTPIYANPNKLKSASAQTSEMIKATVVSAHTGKSVSDSIILSIYNQELGTMTISPEMKTIMAGDSLQFSIRAFDQYGMDMNVNVQWSTDKGTILDNGWLFTDENDEGAAVLTATHGETGMQVSAQLWITGVQPVLTTLEIDPDTLTLTPLSVARFSFSGFDQFGFPYDFDPVWMASAGTIDRNGFYTAPDSTGTYLVEIANLSNDIVATALVEVYCQENLSEQHVICGNDSLFLHSQWIKSAGIFYDTVQVAGACEQIITIEVIHADDPEVALVLSKNTFKTSDAPFTLTGGIPPGGVYTVDDEELTVLDPSLFEPGSYQLHYRYENSDGCAATATATFTVELDVNVPELIDEFMVNIYPNPNKGIFTLIIRSDQYETGVYQLSVSTLSGQEIWSSLKIIQKGVREQVELNDVPAGLYFLTIQNNDQKIVKKLMISK
ncbi:MAG: T9SS type A sorting domain-containing protein, partial [Prolixibacteraceae bacterium]|nr:T9SS type A sorting domain-containing protein [Prolixibacteraceae bacterium]